MPTQALRLYFKWGLGWRKEFGAGEQGWTGQDEVGGVWEAGASWIRPTGNLVPALDATVVIPLSSSAWPGPALRTPGPGWTVSPATAMMVHRPEEA